MPAQMCRHYCANGLQAAAVGADIWVRPSFCACHLAGQTHGSAPTARSGHLQINKPYTELTYIMKSSKCGENDMRLIATRKEFLSTNLMSQLHNAM